MTDLPLPTAALRVAAVQAGSGLDPEANRARLPDLVAGPQQDGGPVGPGGPGGPGGLVVLPEAFARDFGEAGSDVSAFAEPVDGAFARAVEQAASDHDTTVVAGMFETGTDPDRPFNTLVVRGAATADYRKIHLYDSFGYRESDRLTAGAVRPAVVDVDGWRVGLMTCYDLRFPEQARALVDAGAHVLVLPAAWLPGPRKLEHWRTLLLARAIENTCFVVAAAQPAPRYVGHSMVIDPLGDVLAEAGEGEQTISAALDPEALASARRTNPSLANRRAWAR